MVIGLMEPPCTSPFMKGNVMADFILRLFHLKIGFIFHPTLFHLRSPTWITNIKQRFIDNRQVAIYEVGIIRRGKNLLRCR